MRKLMRSVAMTAGVTMVLAAAATEAKANPMVQGLSNQVNTLERINERRPRGEVYQAIAGSIEMVRARLRLPCAGPCAARCSATTRRSSGAAVRRRCRSSWPRGQMSS